MVAVVSGYGLGLFNTTTIGLGNKTKFGQGKESIKINAVTGNLILQQKDDALISQGIDAHLLRTYNSQGLLNDANGDNFRFGFNQQLLSLTGEINQPNSTIQRISADGATTTYTYNTQQQCYISTDGSGAHDKLEYLGDNRWRWTEGSSLITETYHWQNNQGRLITRSDRHGFKIQLEYQHDKVVALRDEQGQTLSIEYTGNNVSAIHHSSASHSSASHSSVKTRYQYDQLNRLTSVIVDLTPEDNSITDNHVYKTQYQYDGDSRRITHIKQSDGTELTINYQQGSDGQFRVSEITEGKGSQAVTTRYVYDLNARKTDIIQVNNATSGTGPTYSLWYDEQGRLTRTANPADAHGFRLEINYQYDNDDNLLTQTDNTGRILSYTYDQYGNRTTEIDAEQNKITRTFNSAQQKISETIYPKGDTQQGVSQYWVYDEKQRISFHLNAEGFLEAYQYQSWGDDQLQQTTTLTYLSAILPVENFSPSNQPSNATIKQWLAQQTSLGHIKRKDQYFDFRGQLHKVVQSQALNQSNLVSTQPNASNILNTTYFIYDTHGQLIKSVDSRGQAPVENSTTRTDEIQHNKDNFETLFVYDGLGRLLASTNSLGETTRYQYQDQLQQVLKTAANGLQTTELYDSVGRIINRTQIDLNTTTGNHSTPTHTFLYDKQGRKIAEQDPSGAISLTFYHRNGQPLATVDAMGYVTEYFYNKTGKQIAQRRYATALSVNTFAALQVRNNEGTLTGIKPTPFESIRPSLSEHDRITRQVFAKNNQLRFSIDGEGAVTEHRYDQAGRKILTIQHAKTLNTPTDLNAQSDLALNITAVQQQLGETLTADDRVQRFFYSKSGQLSGMLDAEGYLTRYGYTATGERSYISQLASRVLNPETDIHQWLTCSLSELQVTPSVQDQHALNFYNAQGWIIAAVDAEGYLTFFAYDAVGNKTLQRRLATQLTHTEQTRLINWVQGKPGRFQAGNDLLLALIQQKQTEQDQLHSYKYDAANRLREETDAQGNTHRYQYNAAGQVIHTTKGIMLAQQHELLNQASTSQAEYDGFGRLIKTTNALGAETLFRYDSAGRKTQQQDAAGHITRFYYDQRGRLTHTINALGEVSAVIYNAFDHAISTRVYITRLTPEQLTSLEGGIITSAVATLFSQLAKESDAIKRNRYNRRGQITEKIDAENNSQQLNYNAFGELNSITQTIRQSLSITQTQYLTYNRRGEKVTTSTSVLQGDALLPDLTTHYTLDAFGRTTQTTNALGHTTTFEYDRLGRQLSITSPNQSTSHTSYDAFNRVLNTTDARGNTTAYQYQKTTATNAEGVEFVTGHQVIVTTPTGLQKITEKNLQGENVRITAPDNTTSEFFYDKAGNLIKTVDALGQETTQQFNQLGWKTSVTQADGLQVHYEYDAVGRQLIQITDPDGLALKEQIQYDALGNKVQVTDANNTLTQHHYNRNGQLTKTVVDPEGLNLITAYEYDNAGNQIRIQQGDANGWQRVTEHRFNGYGQREATIIDPDGLKLTTRFYYDDAGQLIKKINAENHTTQYVYDNVGHLRFTINPQGAVSETQYDNNGNKIAEINYKNTVDASLTYTEQELTAALNSSAEDQWQGLIYDADNRLTFSIDGLGYLTKINYDKNSQIIAKAITKNALSDLVNHPNLTLTDIENRLNNLDTTEWITTERVIYDVLGQTKFKADANGWLTEFQYDQAGRVIAAKRYNVTWQQLELNNDTSINKVNEKVSQWQHTAKPEDIHHESHWYDNAGRRLYTQDAAGYLTGYRFDALGQVVANFKYKTPAPNLRQSRADINQITQHLSANSTIAKANYHVYDTAGRKRFTVNDLGYVTEYRYNALGESITTLRYPHPIAKEHTQNLTAIRAGLKQTPIVVHGTQLHEKSRPILESGLSLVSGTYGQTWEAQEVGTVTATSNWVSKTIKPNQPYKLINSAIKTWSDQKSEKYTITVSKTKFLQSSKLQNFSYGIINNLPYKDKDNLFYEGRIQSPTLYKVESGLSLKTNSINFKDRTPTSVNAAIYDNAGQHIRTISTPMGGEVRIYKGGWGGLSEMGYRWFAPSNWNGQVNLGEDNLSIGKYKVVVTVEDRYDARSDGRHSRWDGDGKWTEVTELFINIGNYLEPLKLKWQDNITEAKKVVLHYRQKGFQGRFSTINVDRENNSNSVQITDDITGAIEYRIEYFDANGKKICQSKGEFLSEDNKVSQQEKLFTLGGDWAEKTTGTAIKGYVSRLDAADIQYLEAQVVNKNGEVVSTALTHPNYITQQLGLYDGSVNLSVGEPLTEGDYQVTITRHFKDNRPAQTETFNYQIGEQPYQAQHITVDAKDLNPQPSEKLVAHYRLASSDEWQAIPLSKQGDKLQLAMPATALTNGEAYQLRVQSQNAAGQPQAQLLGSFSAGQDANVQLSLSQFKASAAQPGTSIDGLIPANLLPQLQAVSIHVKEAASGALMTYNGPIWTWLDQQAGGQVNISDNTQLPAGAYQLTVTYHFKDGTPETASPITITLSDQTTSRAITAFTLPKTLAGMAVRYRPVNAATNHSDTEWQQAFIQLEGDQAQLKLTKLHSATTYEIEVLATGQRLLATTQPETADGSALAGTLKVDGQGQTELQLKHLLTNEQPQVTQQLRDSAGRVTYTVDAMGYVTAYRYDHLNRVIQQTQHATPLVSSLLNSATPLTIAAVTEALNSQTPAEKAANRMVATRFDAAGQQQAQEVWQLGEAAATGISPVVLTVANSLHQQSAEVENQHWEMRWIKPDPFTEPKVELYPVEGGYAIKPGHIKTVDDSPVGVYVAIYDMAGNVVDEYEYTPMGGFESWKEKQPDGSITEKGRWIVPEWQGQVNLARKHLAPGQYKVKLSFIDNRHDEGDADMWSENQWTTLVIGEPPKNTQVSWNTPKLTGDFATTFRYRPANTEEAWRNSSVSQQNEKITAELTQAEEGLFEYQLEYTDSQGTLLKQFTGTFVSRPNSVLVVENITKAQTLNHHNHLGQRTAVTDANGHTTFFAYDAKGQLTRELRPTTVDAEGLATHGQLVEYQYDALGRKVSQRAFVDPVSLASGIAQTIPDTAKARITRYQYDASGQLLKVIGPSWHPATAAKESASSTSTVAPTTSNSTNSSVKLTISNSVLPQSTEVENQHWEMRWHKPDPFTEPTVELYPVAGGYSIKPGHLTTTDNSPTGVYVAIYDMDGKVVDEYEHTGMGGFEYWKEKQPDGSVVEKGRWIVPEWNGQVNLARTELPAGRYRVNVSFLDNRHDEADKAMWSDSQWVELVIGQPATPTKVSWQLPEALKDTRVQFRYRPTGTDQPWQTSNITLADQQITAELTKAAFGEFNYQLTYVDAQGNTVKQLTGIFTSRPNSTLVVGENQPAPRPQPTPTPAEPSSPIVTAHQYDFLGRQVSTTEAVGTDQQRTTQRQYDARGLKIAETQAAGQMEATTQRFHYDALGQLSATTDGRGSALVDSDSAWALAERTRAGIVDAQGYGKRASALTMSERKQLLAQYTQHQQIDSLGRKISQTDASGHTIHSQFDAFGNLIQSTDARGAVRHFFYDANNRLQLEVDAAGYATHYTYTASDHVAQKTRYQQALDLAQVHPQADVTKLLEQLDKGGVQQQTRFEYDAAGRVTLEHDGTYQQTYQYDGVGNKTAHTDKNGYTSYFEYNAAGQLTRKQSPKVQVVTDALAGKVEAQHLITTHRYDALGRKTATTEAAGTALAATILYEYDAQDRLIKEVLPSRNVLQLQTNGESQARAVKPELSRVYDLAGNLIQHTDGNGNRTTYYFNAVNQKVAEVTANGVLTQFEYDAAGNMIRQRVYDDPVSLPVARHQPPQPNANASFRETHTQFDAQNRELASTAQRGLFYSAEQGYFEGQQRTQNQFDANGNLTVKVDANGQQQFTWYDAKNQAVLVVDAAGYVTQQAFDGAGNLIKSHRYAQPLPQTLWRSLTADTPLTAIEQGLTPLTSDRITTHRYNAQNQRVETRLLGIQHNEVLADGQLQQGVADQVTTYGYDALGHQVLIRKFGEMTTANGEKQVVGNVEQRQQQFDALGRQTTAQNTHFTDASGAQVTPTTVVGYNALGQSALQVQKANANTAPYDLADQDLITRHHYDAAGLLRKTVDANGAGIDFHYDAQGNVVRKDELRTQADGTRHTIQTRFGYDALNREVSRIDAEGTIYQTHYNSHGQVTEKIINGKQHEFFEYDQLGRLVKTNQQTGATRLYGYDQNGNMTLHVASAGADLSQLSLAQLRNLDLKSDTAAQLAVTVQRYDVRNQLTDVIQPEMTTLIKDAELTKVDQVVEAKPFTRGALDIQGGERFQVDIKLYAKARRHNYPEVHYNLHEFHVSWQGLEGYTGKLKLDWDTGFNPNAKGSWTVDASAGIAKANRYGGHWWRHASAHSIHNDGIYYHINVYKQDENQQWELLTKLDNRYQWSGAYHSQGGQAAVAFNEIIHQNPRLLTLKDQPRDASRVRLYYRPKQEADYAARPYNEENYNPAKYTHYVDGSRLKVNETTSRWGFDLTNAPGLEKGKAYEYYYEVLDHKGRLANRAEGIINWGGSDNTSATHSNTGRPPVKRSTMDYLIGEGKLEQHAIHRQQRFNAFGEIIAETDGLGNKTAFSYNKLGKLTEKQGATVSVTHANGFIEQLRPTTHYHTDLQGRTVGVTDANGHTNTQQWLEDRVVKEFHADGGVKQFHYDAFGRKQQETNELGQVTQFHYDNVGNLLHVDRAGSNDDHYTYDEAGNRISHTNALGHKETYRYDGMSRVRAHTDNLGHTTQYDYQWDADIGAERFDEATDAYKKQSEHAIGGWRKTTTDAEGNQRVDHHDLYNRIRFHRDMGGRQTWYDYNQAGWLVAQRGDTKLNNDKHFDQEIHYRYYNNGYIKGIDDLGINAFAEFQYDANGNLTFEGYSYSDAERGHEKVYTQRSFISYDAANRIDHIKDEQYELRYEYDAVGNRRRVFSRYLQPNGLTASQDFWYAYDAMNRFTITQGQLNGERATDKASHAVNVVAGDKGYAVTYNALGQRTSAQHGQNHEAYAYDTNGFLSTTHINDALRARRINDAAGNASEYLEYKSDGNLLKHVRNTYNANNRKIQEHTVTDGNNTGVKYSFDKAGNLKQSVTYGRDPELTTRYTYELWDDYKQKQIELKACTDADLQYDWAPGFSFFEYDANGHVSMARDDYHQRIFRYVNNHKGQVLRRTEKGEGYLKTHNYYYVNGLGIGDVGDDGPSYTDYATQLALSEGLQRKPDKITPVYSADFDANYQPISADYPAQSPGSYTVNKGDTLQSIARALWGDSSLWFLIADANGIEDPQALKEGLVLTIPNKVTNIHNNSSTYRPYQPGLALGDTSPTLPDMPPPPHKEGACGGAAELIIMVVAIAAAAFVGPVVQAMMQGMNTFVTAVAVGASSQAAANAAGQLAGMAMGVQSGFSFSQVAKAGIRGAVSGAVSYGVGQGLTELGKGTDGFQWAKQASDFLNNADNYWVKKVVGDIASQGVGMALGWQKKYDWRQTAVAGANGYIGQKIGLTAEMERAKASSFVEARAPAYFKSSMLHELVQTAVYGDGFDFARAAAGTIGHSVGGAYGKDLENYVLQKRQSDTLLTDINEHPITQERLKKARYIKDHLEPAPFNDPIHKARYLSPKQENMMAANKAFLGTLAGKSENSIVQERLKKARSNNYYLDQEPFSNPVHNARYLSPKQESMMAANKAFLGSKGSDRTGFTWENITNWFSNAWDTGNKGPATHDYSFRSTLADVLNESLNYSSTQSDSDYGVNNYVSHNMGEHKLRYDTSAAPFFVQNSNDYAIGKMFGLGSIFSPHIEHYNRMAASLGGEVSSSYNEFQEGPARGIIIAVGSVIGGLALGRYGPDMDLNPTRSPLNNRNSVEFDVPDRPSISGSAHEPRVSWLDNADGRVLSADEAFSLARAQGFDIPDYVDIKFKSGWSRPDADAEYLVQFKHKQVNLDQPVLWDDIVNPDTGRLDIHINADVLRSDERALAHVVHEVYEAKAIYNRMTELDEFGAPPMTWGQLRKEIANNPSVKKNWHTEAWDAADISVRDLLLERGMTMEQFRNTRVIR
ncbi:LysM peptidoglycan-binding domain-containing protein [Zooshikella marina]|uniref:LysM peptidoglycan-binding domain-containing protein n=1 Tax=Zooshikella ganghwensis TaxID=202772 RepID=UPI001BAF6F3B|nr:LysM peptidoglycan-binding domain-containing protein [Zooshikella ganghwensis]MBU2707852.1 LysM peptidoglycan-binding domain-containing protein [Zooshikella ganghwensis]